MGHFECNKCVERRQWSVDASGEQVTGTTLLLLVRAVHHHIFDDKTPTVASKRSRLPLDAALAQDAALTNRALNLSPSAAGVELATHWGLAQLPCFYATSAADDLLPCEPVSYLIRASSSDSEHLVLVVRDSTAVIQRLLFKQLRPGVWQSGVGDKPVPGSFADFVRTILPANAVPLNDSLRAQASTAAKAVDELSLEDRAQSFRGRSMSGRHSPGLAPSGANVLVRTPGAPASPAPRHSRFNGRESNVYLSMSVALALAKENEEFVRDGTQWTCVARKEALASLDPKHNDVDGTSLATESYYFYDIDTFGANALLASLPQGTFLVRLNSLLTQFVVSFTRSGSQVAHVLVKVDASKQTAQAPGCRVFPTVRELVRNTPAFKIPLSRATIDCEFVDCAIVLQERPLGKGVGGVVLRGRLNDSVDIAVKRLLHPDDKEGDIDVDDPAYKNRRLSEAEAMLKISPHPNVTRLYGLVLKPTSLVVELCDGGSLDKLLGIDGSAPPLLLPMPDCVQLALQIARGVAHLHRARIVHRDLASRNILIKLPMVPKVTDFGMSRLLQEEESAAWTKERRGPVKWQAPEQMRGELRIYSYKTDVFSFAVLLSEIVSSALPWCDDTNINAAVNVLQGRRTAIAARVSPLLRMVIEQCWAQNADERPQMEQVVELLGKPNHYGQSIQMQASAESHYDDNV